MTTGVGWDLVRINYHPFDKHVPEHSWHVRPHPAKGQRRTPFGAVFKSRTDKYLQYYCRNSQQVLTSSSFLSRLLLINLFSRSDPYTIFQSPSCVHGKTAGWGLRRHRLESWLSVINPWSWACSICTSFSPSIKQSTPALLLSQDQREGPHQTLNQLPPWSWTFQPPELWETNVCCLSQAVNGILL